MVREIILTIIIVTILKHTKTNPITGFIPNASAPPPPPPPH
jgi:hypothetical protein